MSSPASEFLSRLERVEDRLRVDATRTFPPDALTPPDPPTGERWEAGQVWAHVAEFIPYWLGEAHDVIAHRGERPELFGRTKSDPGRVAAIERDRSTDAMRLWHRITADIANLRTFLEGLDDRAWSARALHPTLGEMDLARIVDEFLVGHLEQHATQLDGLLST